MPPVLRVGFLGTGLIARFHAEMLRGSGEEFEPGPGPRPRSRPGRGVRHRVRLPGRRHRGGACSTAATPSTSRRGPPSTVGWWRPPPSGAGTCSARSRWRSTPPAPGRWPTAVEAAGVVAQVGLVLRRSPAFGLAGSLLSDERAGRVMAVVFRDDQFIPIRGHYGSSWRADPRLAGAGTLLEHSIHDLDLLEHLLGPATSIACRTVDVPRAPRHRRRRRRHARLRLRRDRLPDVGVARRRRAAERCAGSRSSASGPSSPSRATGSGPVTLAVRRRRRRVGRSTATSCRRDEAARRARSATPTARSCGPSATAGRRGRRCRDAVRAHELADACYASAALGGVAAGRLNARPCRSCGRRRGRRGPRRPRRGGGRRR